MFLAALQLISDTFEDTYYKALPGAVLLCRNLPELVDLRVLRELGCGVPLNHTHFISTTLEGLPKIREEISPIVKICEIQELHTQPSKRSELGSIQNDSATFTCSSKKEFITFIETKANQVTCITMGY